MHPVFAVMSDALKESSKPEAADMRLARKLTEAMPSSFAAEGSRRDNINAILNENLFMNLSPAVPLGVAVWWMTASTLTGLS